MDIVNRSRRLITEIVKGIASCDSYYENSTFKKKHEEYIERMSLRDGELKTIGTIKDFSSEIQKRANDFPKKAEEHNSDEYHMGEKISEKVKMLAFLVDADDSADSMQEYLLMSLKSKEDYSVKVIRRLSQLKDTYEKTSQEMKKYEKEIKDLLGDASEKTIAGSFEESAKDERKMANTLRWFVIFGLSLIVLIVLYSLWETSSKSVQWENVIIRMSFIVSLSIPIAYLARESTKHRNQQYKHLQMALELKATTPYWRSLPEDEQNKLKIELSKKIFAQNKENDSIKESYPLNTQELVSKLIDKFPTIKDIKS